MKQPDRKELLAGVKTLVVKVGTNVLADQAGALDKKRVRAIAAQVAAARRAGRRVALVSSGAIGAGLAELGLNRRPRALPALQAAAAVGQRRLMELYGEAFGRHRVKVGQVLLTRADVEDRHRYLNAANTLHELFRADVVPVINENDTLSVEEIAFGDNDTLSALMTNLIKAELLVILTVVPGLCRPGSRTAVPLVKRIDESVRRLATGELSRGGIGGMEAKLEAAAIVSRAGGLTVIADGRQDGVLARVLSGAGEGTLFLPAGKGLSSRKRWIGFGSRPRGRIVVDAGARAAVAERGKSLLPSGVIAVEGQFEQGDLVAIVDQEGREFARGMSNYSAADAARVRGRKTSEVRRLLGRLIYEELVHRDNLTLTGN